MYHINIWISVDFEYCYVDLKKKSFLCQLNKLSFIIPSLSSPASSLSAIEYNRRSLANLIWASPSSSSPSPFSSSSASSTSSTPPSSASSSTSPPYSTASPISIAGATSGDFTTRFGPRKKAAAHRRGGWRWPSSCWLFLRRSTLLSSICGDLELDTVI